MDHDGSAGGGNLRYIADSATGSAGSASSRHSVDAGARPTDGDPDNGAPIVADFDFRQTGPQTWDIEVETDAGALLLSQGGAVLTLPEGARQASEAEYPALYARFAQLIGNGASEVDTAPLRLVADAVLHGRTIHTDAFYD